MCDKKNIVLFTDTACIVLSPNFKLTDESHVLLKVPRKDNMYNVDLKNVVPQGGLTCLFAKATPDEFNLWHRRLGYVNFKTMNKLGIKREFSVARTPQQNRVTERKNKTLIEVAGTMLADSKLPTTFWTEAVNTACHVQNRVLVIKPHNKTPYELFLGKFDGKADEGFFVGYSTNSKAFRDAEDPRNKDSEVPSTKDPRINQEKETNINNTNNINTVSPTVNAAGIEDNVVDENIVYRCVDDPKIPNLEEIAYSVDDEDNDVEADMNNLNSIIPVSPIPITRLHKDHPLEQIIRDTHSAPQTRRMTKSVTKHEEPKKMDVKSAFLYGKIEEKVYVCQPPGFEDLDFPDKVYKVEKVLYELHQAPRAWYETLSTYLLDNGFQRGKIDNTLFIRRVKGDIFLVQVYVDDIIFGSTKKSLSTEFEKMMHKKFQISSMGELTFFLGLQVKHKEDGIFINQDNDYAGASLDRKSTIGGCQFLGCRLISWQCKKQTVVANSTTEAEYIAASNCCGQVLWIQNQLLDYGYNFMQTKIHIDNESTICIVKNPVFHSKTKHIEIRHHFIRDSYEKKLIQMIKIHTDQNVADLLTKAFDVSRFQYLIASIGMLNL
ncbi:putative ribonuclease H-like domain-containing protein [Tanacetum coccineum]